MKLPDDPKEKTKILILIGIGVVAVLYTTIALVVKPLFAEKARCRIEIAALEAKLEMAQRDMNRMLKDRPGNTRALEQIVDVSNRRLFILHPSLGNYELGARAYLENQSQSAGVALTTIREIGITQIPKPAKGPALAFKSYNLRVGIQAGMHDALRLVEAIEKNNPYLSVSSLSVVSRPESPGRHEITMEIQWPIWEDPQMSEIIEQRLQDALAYTPPAMRQKQAGDRSAEN